MPSIVYYDRTIIAVITIIAGTVFGLVNLSVDPGWVIAGYQGVLALFVAGNLGGRADGDVDKKRTSVRKLSVTLAVIICSAVFGALRDGVNSELLMGSIFGAAVIYAGGRAAQNKVTS